MIRRAHTMIELVIVLIVLGIVAAIAIPMHLDSLSRFRVQAAARRVAADLEFARRKAMDELNRIQKDGEAGEDEVNRAEKDLDKTTAKYVAQIDELVKHKEAELMEV